MQSLSLHTHADRESAPDLARAVERLEKLLDERRGELARAQAELREFKLRYTQVVGGRLAELAEIEAAIREAEARLLGIAEEDEETPAEVAHVSPVRTTLRKLYWSVAKMFHPDHAADEGEARRRHTIMAEASRAYREGDVESLNTLLGDGHLQSICAAARDAADEEDMAGRLLHLKEELRTVEFGLRRVRQDGMYRLKLSADEEARHGRDALAAMAARVGRQIIKARRRLEHFS